MLAKPSLPTQNRTSQFELRDAAGLEPHSAYIRLMTIPSAPENVAFPVGNFPTKICQDQLNKKLRTSVNCVAVRAFPLFCWAFVCTSRLFMC